MSQILSGVPTLADLIGYKPLRQIIPKNWKVFDGIHFEDIQDGDTVISQVFNDKLPDNLNFILLISFRFNINHEELILKCKQKFKKISFLCLFEVLHFPYLPDAEWLFNEDVYFCLGWSYNLPTEIDYFRRFKKLIPLFSEMGEPHKEGQCTFCPLSIMGCDQKKTSRDCEMMKISYLSYFNSDLWIKELIGGSQTIFHDFIKGKDKSPLLLPLYKKELKNFEDKQASDQSNEPMPKLLS